MKPQTILVPLTATGSKGPTNPSAQTCSFLCSKNISTRGNRASAYVVRWICFEPLVGTLGRSVQETGDMRIVVYLR
jgi:hypothetical protein